MVPPDPTRPPVGFGCLGRVGPGVQVVLSRWALHLFLLRDWLRFQIDDMYERTVEVVLVDCSGLSSTHCQKEKRYWRGSPELSTIDAVTRCTQ